MQIQMRETRFGSEDGRTAQQYQKNEVYNVADSLGQWFVRQGTALKIDQNTGKPIYGPEHKELQLRHELVNQLERILCMAQAGAPKPFHPDDKAEFDKTLALIAKAKGVAHA